MKCIGGDKLFRFSALYSSEMLFFVRIWVEKLEVIFYPLFPELPDEKNSFGQNFDENKAIFCQIEMSKGHFFGQILLQKNVRVEPYYTLYDVLNRHKKLD